MVIGEKTGLGIHLPKAAHEGASPIYMLFLLSSVNFLNALDKLIMSVLVEPVKAEFGLSDSAIGMLAGLSVAVSTSIAMIPLGILADRTNRRNLIAVCLALWSTATALGGAAHTYLQLLLTRILVGVGEAGGGPPSLSMISDIFPKDRRATALSVFYMAAPVGGIAALGAGGWIGGHYGWRATLIAAAAPGLVIALILFLTGTEPARGRLDLREADSPAGLFRALRHIVGCRSLMHLFAGITLASLVLSAMAVWAPAFYIRTHALPVEQAGAVLAMVQATGLIGPIVSAAVADRLAARDQRWWCWISATGVGFGSLALVVFLSVPDFRAALLFNCVFTITMSIWFGPCYATVQSLTPPSLRATVTAVLYVVANIIGFGLGVQFVGAISDVLAPHAGHDSLRYSLILLGLFGGWAGGHLIFASLTIRQDLFANVDEARASSLK